MPTLIPHPPSDLERELFGLPVSLGGLGICDPCRISTDDYNFSLELSRPLVDLILHQHGSLPHDVIDSQYIILKQLSQAKYQSQIDAIQSVLTRSSSILRQTIEHCQDKGVSSWLSVIPIEQYGFALHKNEFTDALCLRYGWTPPHLPSHCVCGKAFSVTHALSCPHGAFPIIRHNDVRDLTAKLLSEVCHDVQTEPHLQPLTGEILRYRTAVHEDDARVDIRAAGFWGCRHHRSFLMSVFLMPLLRAINPPVWLQLSSSMKEKNVVLTRSVCGKWKEAVLLLLCSPPWEEWGRLLQ